MLRAIDAAHGSSKRRSRSRPSGTRDASPLLPALAPPKPPAEAVASPLGLKRHFAGLGERTTFPALSPLLVQIEDLLSAAECRDLIAVGARALSRGAAGVHAADPAWQEWRTCAGQHKRAKFPTSKAHISAVFHSFRLILGRAIISRNGLEA